MHTTSIGKGAARPKGAEWNGGAVKSLEGVMVLSTGFARSVPPILVRSPTFDAMDFLMLEHGGTGSYV